MRTNQKIQIRHWENVLCPLQKQQGFALVILCLLLPVILTACIFVYIGTIQIEMTSTLHQLCRQELLTAQAQSSKILQKIMVSNPMRSDLKKNLTDNRNTSVILADSSRQELLSALAKHTQLSLNKGKARIQKSLQNFQQKLDPLVELSGMEVTGLPNSAFSIQMNVHNLLDFSNPIQIKENFERLQSLTLSWKYQLKLFPNFIIAYSWSQNFEGHCSATLKKEKPWPPTLYEDKFFWKPS